MTNKIETQINDRLQALGLTHLEVMNESSGHGGYFPGKESHFKVVAVGPIFEGMSRVKRHQAIFSALGEFVPGNQIHALAVHAYTPDEWTGQAPASTPCAHARSD